MKHDGGWTQQTSRYIFQSPWFNLRQDEVTLPTGEEITYTLVEHQGYAMVVPILEDRRVLLERVYQRATLNRSARCIGLGVKPKQNLLPPQVRETHDLSMVILNGKFRSLTADFEH